MSENEASAAASRGSTRRQQNRDLRRQREALAWWSKPGIWIFLAALAVAALGWGLVIREGQRIPVEQAEVDGLHIELSRARWILDQMDHGENFQKPSVMMPDMPEWGSQRVTLDLSFHNRSNKKRLYAGEEFFLVPEIGEEVPPIGAQIGQALIAPGQSLNTALHFDFDTREPHGKLRVAWRHQDETVYLPIPEPAEHYHLRPRGGEVALPQDARLLLPIGKVARGKSLYDNILGCGACHGDPAIPDSNNIGPHLGRIALEAETRIEGLPGPQYLYDSIRDPAAFIAPECKGGVPCETPTAMPEYASLMNLQDFADVVAYLLEQDG